MFITRRLISLVALLMVALALAACGGGVAEPTTAPVVAVDPTATPLPEPTATLEPTTTPEPMATTEPSDAWIAYAAPDGSFTVLLPKQPQVSSQTVTTAAGDIAISMYSVEEDNTTVLVGVNGFPQSIIDQIASGDETVIKSMLDGGRNGAVSNVNGTFLNERDLTVNGFPSREFTFTIDGANSPNGASLLGTARIILTSDSLFQLITIERQDQADEAMVQKFFDSFQLAVSQ